MAVTPMLSPNNAVLTTASIEVAVLRLDKRQVTQAVFRQVPERSPIAANGGLIAGAVPWGHVNYWWSDAEKTYTGAIHLLWQLGNSLFRARLWPDIKPEFYGRPGFPFTGELITPPTYDKACLESLFWHRWIGDPNAPFADPKLSVELFGDDYDVSPRSSWDPSDTSLFAHMKTLGNIAHGHHPHWEILRHCGVEQSFRDLGADWGHHRHEIYALLGPAIRACMQRTIDVKLLSLEETLAALEQTRRRRDQATAAIETYNTKTFPMLAALDQLYIAA